MNEEIAYQEALDYLYSFVDYSLTRAFRYSPDKFDLGRMHDFVKQLGNPQESYPVIHVAGSKGKGSVFGSTLHQTILSERDQNNICTQKERVHILPQPFFICAMLFVRSFFIVGKNMIS